MGKRLVVKNAQLRCTMGTAPSSLNVVRPNTHDDGNDFAIITDSAPMQNIQAFGMCQSAANPQVAAATSAAMGVLTPQPCIPATAAPWSPGSSVSFIDQTPMLTEDSTCNCNWAGTVSITIPGTKVETD